MSHAEKVVSNIIQIKIHRCQADPLLMPDIDIASSCSSLLTPAEEYLGYPSYGEHIGLNSFDLCHAGSLAAAAAEEAEEATAIRSSMPKPSWARHPQRRMRQPQGAHGGRQTLARQGGKRRSHRTCDTHA